jgi:hypothetical protein
LGVFEKLNKNPVRRIKAKSAADVFISYWFLVTTKVQRNRFSKLFFSTHRDIQKT